MVHVRLFLLSLLVCHFVSSSVTSPSTTWIAVTPQRPVVEAIVESTLWRMSTETSSPIPTTLSVLERSKLTLICRAAYPVLWQHKDQAKGIPSQSRTCDPLTREDAKLCSGGSNFEAFTSAGFQIPATDQYQSNMTLENFSAQDTGTFVCQPDVASGDKPFHITIQLETHSEPKPANFAQILQSGFDQVQPQMAASDLHFASPPLLRVSIVYTKPTGVETKVLLKQEHDGTACLALTDPTNSAIVTPQAQMAIDTKALTPNIEQASITISRRMYLCKGKYQFVVQSRLKDNAVVNVTSQFWLSIDTVETQKVGADMLSNLNASLELNILWFYELRMYVSTSAALTEAYLQAEERQLQGAECASIPVPAEKLKDICGIRTASLFDKGVRIFLSTTFRSCTLTVLTKNFSNSRQLSNSRNSETVPLKSSLFTAGYNGDIFGHTFSLQGAKMISDVKDVWGNGAKVYANDSLRLKCLVPHCHFLWISWQKVDLTSWTLDGLTSYPPLGSTILAHTPNFVAGTHLSVSTHDIKTMSYDLVFPSLNKSHSGKYICGITRSPDRQQMIRPPMAHFWINVTDPTPPRFASGGRFGESNVLLHDGKAELTCKPEGDPKPKISWTWEAESKDGFVQPKLSADNETAEVFRPGAYRCYATSKYGQDGKIFSVREVSYLPYMIAIAVAVIAFATMAAFVWVLRRRAANKSFKSLARQLKSHQQTTEVDLNKALNDQVDALPYDCNYEIERDLVTLSPMELGVGEFGRVVKGELKSGDNSGIIKVAVKVPKGVFNVRDYQSLADELKLMSNIGPHVNVLSLIGACTAAVEQRELLVLTEFCENGSLQDYLIKNKMKFEGFEVNKTGQFIGSPGAVETLLKYAYQAAHGMAHLSASNIIHGDLALRNLLLTANHIVKVSDFGMSRQNKSVYQKRFSISTRLPICWMALESLLTLQYTQMSDVWSFGVVLWEMFSCGNHPYAGHDPHDISAFRSWLRQSDKNRLGPPSIQCEEMYHLMLTCWRRDPESRPTFSACKRIISQALQDISVAAYQSLELTLSDAWLSVSPAIQRFKPEPVIPAKEAVEVDALLSTTDAEVNIIGEKGDPQEETRVTEYGPPQKYPTIFSELDVEIPYSNYAASLRKADYAHA